MSINTYSFILRKIYLKSDLY